MFFPETQARLSPFGFVFEELGELFDFLSFLDHTDREHFGGCSLLNFFAQLPRQLIKPFDPFAEFFLVLLHANPFCRGHGLWV